MLPSAEQEDGVSPQSVCQLVAEDPFKRCQLLPELIAVGDRRGEQASLGVGLGPEPAWLLVLRDRRLLDPSLRYQPRMVGFGENLACLQRGVLSFGGGLGFPFLRGHFKTGVSDTFRG
jgi:hypothetical protein